MNEASAGTHIGLFVEAFEPCSIHAPNPCLCPKTRAGYYDGRKTHYNNKILFFRFIKTILRIITNVLVKSKP